MISPRSPGRIVRITPIVGVVAAIIALHAIGSGPLAAPSTPSIEGLIRWAESGDPVSVSFALLRLAALILAYHLAFTMALAMLGRISGRRWLINVAERLALPMWRGAIRRMVGVGLSTAIGFTAPMTVAAASDPGAPSGVATLRIESPVESEDDAGGTATLRVDLPLDTAVPGEPQGDRVPDAPPAEPFDHLESASERDTAAPSTTPTTADATTTSSAPHRAGEAAPGNPESSPQPDHSTRSTTTTERVTMPSIGDAAAPTFPSTSTSSRSGTGANLVTDRQHPRDTEPFEPAHSDPVDAKSAGVGAVRHVVEPGDHLWALAESRLMSEYERQMTDAEIAPYWQAIIDANPQLADPDLIFPGDVVVLPPTS